MAKDKDPYWIEHAHLHKGALHEATYTPAGKDTSEKQEHAAAYSKNSTVRKEAELAQTLKNIRK